MSRSIELAPDAVDVWIAPLDLDEHEMEGMLARLSPSERKRVGALLEEKAVRQYVVSRAMQRQILAGYVGGSPSEISFGVVAMGKPTLSHPNDIGLTFNTTHSGNRVIIAVTANRDVGVDAESIRPIPRALKVSKRVFSPEEHEMLSSLPPEELDRAFLSIWVRREGTAKARGDSVWRGLASWKNGEIENSAGRRDWRVEYIDLGPQFIGVVVAKGDDWRVEMRGRPTWDI
ncbi:MAG TPA: 4'-phosphopantetheinyl transferase superfamily protein [Gemmatimonadaceae bacterium]|nr:4'-phosphopantetheinyl transferase superfamily protein [Gemmatimonadaceae bacterium]